MDNVPMSNLRRGNHFEEIAELIQVGGAVGSIKLRNRPSHLKIFTICLAA
jgi:hypothetical protein